MEANYIDLPTVLIYLFWIGFGLLIIYIRREDKRVGYPLDSDRKGVPVQGYPAIPSPRAPRAKHPALVGSDEPMHQQPAPADAAQSFAGGDASVGLAYALEAAAAAPAKPAATAAPPAPEVPAAPAPEAHPHDAPPAAPADEASESSDEELDR